jgi:transcriptional regulator with XRE-family HTH domain
VTWKTVDLELNMLTNDYRENLGKILKQQRLAANLTLYDLSAASGVSPSHLGRIEKGARFPSADILQRIAKPLKFSEEELFTLAGYLSPHVDEEKYMPSAKTAHNQLDPYVARVLGQEPIEVQRAVVGILTILKSISFSLTPAATAAVKAAEPAPAAPSEANKVAQ